MFTAAKSCVLQYMGNSAGVFGDGAQSHQKDVLSIVRGQVIVHRASGPVFKLLHANIEGLNSLLPNGFEGGVGTG